MTIDNIVRGQLSVSIAALLLKLSINPAANSLTPCSTSSALFKSTTVPRERYLAKWAQLKRGGKWWGTFAEHSRSFYSLRSGSLLLSKSMRFKALPALFVQITFAFQSTGWCWGFGHSVHNRGCPHIPSHRSWSVCHGWSGNERHQPPNRAPRNGMDEERTSIQLRTSKVLE